MDNLPQLRKSGYLQRSDPPLRRATIGSCRRSMHPRARSEHAICGRWITPLRQRPRTGAASSRTLSGAYVHPAEHAGPNGLSQESGRRLTICRDLECQTACRDVHEAENTLNRTARDTSRRKTSRSFNTSHASGREHGRFRMMSGWRPAASSRRAPEGRWIWAVTPRDRHDAVIQWWA